MFSKKSEYELIKIRIIQDLRGLLVVDVRRVKAIVEAEITRVGQGKIVKGAVGPIGKQSRRDRPRSLSINLERQGQIQRKLIAGFFNVFPRASEIAEVHIRPGLEQRPATIELPSEPPSRQIPANRLESGVGRGNRGRSTEGEFRRQPLSSLSRVATR